VPAEENSNAGDKGGIGRSVGQCYRLSPKAFGAIIGIEQGTVRSSSLVLHQNHRETPNFVESAVERRGCRTNAVWLAEIAFHVSRFEFVEQSAARKSLHRSELRSKRLLWPFWISGPL